MTKKKHVEQEPVEAYEEAQQAAIAAEAAQIAARQPEPDPATAYANHEPYRESTRRPGE